MPRRGGGGRARREAGERRRAGHDEARAREAVVRLLERAVDVELVQPQLGHASTPSSRSSRRTRRSSYGTSTASGAGSPSRMLRIHAAWRASTETIRAAARNAPGVTAVAWPLYAPTATSSSFAAAAANASASRVTAAKSNAGSGSASSASAPSR